MERKSEMCSTMKVKKFKMLGLLEVLEVREGKHLLLNNMIRFGIQTHFS